MTKTQNKQLIFPWWFIYLGWAIAVATIVVSSVFIIFYAIMMGDSETRKWLTSILLSIVTSICIVQPMTVSGKDMVWTNNLNTKCFRSS